MVKTQTYKLDYFKQGSYYSAESDKHRFLTLDYNLQSYVGIVGVGVINGWEIEDVGGLQVQILPGTGIITGYFAESPYDVKLRSDMVMGDREIEVLNENSTVYDPLDPIPRATYISIIQAYDSSFMNPDTGAPIENCYVKTVVPYVINLSDDSDTYIYAQRPTGAKPYPLLADYPTPPGSNYPPLPLMPPNRSNYSTFDAYQADLNIYNAQIAAIHNYEWYGSSANHFTQVDFTTSSSYINSNIKTLLGKVVVRGGAISKIDTSQVVILANLYSLIKEYALQYLTTHKHGGNKFYDPPRIRLETDIRECALYNYNKSNGKTTYLVLQKTETDIVLGHKHTYQVDASGNGQTYEQIGYSVGVPAYSHFHKISASVVGDPEYSVNLVEPHTHTIQSTSDQGDTWDATSPFIVYVNDSVFGDETTSYVHTDAVAKTITFDKGISSSLNKYSCTFDVTLENPFPDLNPNAPLSSVYTYTYEGRSASVFNFMLAMELDYTQKFIAFYTEELGLLLESSVLPSGIDPTIGGQESNAGIIADNLKTHPFVFISTSDLTYSKAGTLRSFYGSASGLDDLKTQSTAAQVLLQKENDTFTFTPNAARNITIVLKEKGYIDSVQVEILGNTEVTGKLGTENVLFVNANKILSGEFIAEVVPFISHAGRMDEPCYPLQYSLVSNDGFKYTAVPTITDVNLGHYHKMLVDTNVVGATISVMIGNDHVYYGEDSNGKLYFIEHEHGVTGSVLSSESNGLLEWQSNVAGSNVTTSVHTHNIVYPVVGNDKVIYAIKEDIHGNIYVGTSDGLMIIPISSAYQFVINGVELYFYGDDLWDLMEKAGAQYQVETGNPVVITRELYGEQFDNTSSELVNDGDTILLTAISSPDRQPDQIMIQKVSSFHMPNFNYVSEKQSYEVLNTEQIIGTTANGASVVIREFNDVPVWSMVMDTALIPVQPYGYVGSSSNEDIFVVGSDFIAKSVGIDKTPYMPWSLISTPFSVGITRKIIKDTGDNYWVCTNNGIFVSRNYNEGNTFEITRLPGGTPDILDIIEGESGSIYCVSTAGLFKTTDGGKNWSKVYDVIGGFKQIVRDRTLDKTNSVSGHYHLLDVDIDGNGFLAESIGLGTPHIHIVSSWTIETTLGHTHRIIVSMYIVDNNGLIYMSRNNNTSWIRHGELPGNDCSEIFAAFGFLFVSQPDGLYKSSDGHMWNKVLSDKVYSFDWTYDLNGFYMGSENAIYETLDGTTITEIHRLEGSPASTLMDNGTVKYFGYAYSNMSKTFCFKRFEIVSSELTALIDFTDWFPTGGTWETTDPYDIYVNYKKVLSTKSNVDKREIYEYDFKVYPTDGIIDFSAYADVNNDVNVYDTIIHVSNNSGLVAGDKVVISSQDESLYTTLTDSTSSDITLSVPSSKNIVIPATVKRIPPVNGNSSVVVNIYNSLLSNIGTLTHYQLEDGLSNYSDGKPYQFNDTYLSNLLQLTQAVRYVYPNIDSSFINSMFYDFRYSWSSTDPVYPSIYDYIDVVTSEVYNQNIYDSLFVGNGAKSINRILIGYGLFAGKIIVATDIGIFWAVINSSLENNWSYVPNFVRSVYDIMIFYGNLLYAATLDGTYYTSDLITWTKIAATAVDYPAYSLGLRWANKSSVSTIAHTASFSSNADHTIGTIISDSGNLYKNFQINQGVKITGADLKSGGYIINSISDGGTGFGSKMTVYPAFPGSDETITGTVVITMGSWWGQWNGEENTSNPALTNTLLLGGDSRISYNDGGTVESWTESDYESEISSFITRRFLPLSNGRLLLSVIGKDVVNQKNYLLKSDNIGENWSAFRSFEEVKGKIVISKLSDFGNTVLTVTFTQPLNYIYVNGILDQQDISIFRSDLDVAVFKGKVIGNEKKDSTNTVTVFGNEAQFAVDEFIDCNFIIYPSKINTMAESDQGTLMYGTNKGIYYDADTVVNNVYPQGTIMNAGINGSISQIDISGSIVSLGFDSSTGNSILYVDSSVPIRGDEQVGKFLYITDTNPVEKYEIVTNGSMKPGNESLIQIKDSGVLTSFYVGKRFRIIGETSRVYIGFDLPVSNNQFNGGKLYVMDNSNKYDNSGLSYNIVDSTSTYVDLDVALIPASTLVERTDGLIINDQLATTTTTTLAKTELQVGQNVRLIDSSGKMVLWVSLDREVKENSLTGMSFQFNDIPASGDIGLVPIYSNLKNSISLTTTHYSVFEEGQSFTIMGSIFEQMGGFSHLKTSVESGHYHEVETVDAIVSGAIGSFGTINASYVDINVVDTINFNNPIVQPVPFRGDLFEDAQIIFTNTENINLRYITEVVSYTATSIRVRVKSASYWNFVSSDSLLISVGWNWEIDATNYGYTNGITYDDFVVIGSGVTSDVDARTNTIVVESTSGMIVGDKISIQDDTLSSEIHYIQQIVNATTFKTTTNVGRSYYVSRNSQIKVLRDTFTNTHIHQIRNNEVEILNISDYLDKGYPSAHSHRVLPLISDVSVLLNNNGMNVFGSSSIIYNSIDNGETWNKLADMNDYLEGSDEVQGISEATLNGASFVVGATNGNIFTQI